MTDHDPTDDDDLDPFDLFGVPMLAIADEPVDPETLAADLALDGDDLTPIQATFAALIASGRTITDAAAHIGITRQTGSGWINHDPAVRAAVNRGRQRIGDRILDQAEAVALDALDVLGRAVRAGNLSAAVQAVRLLNVGETVTAARRRRDRAPITTADDRNATHRTALDRAREADAAELAALLAR